MGMAATATLATRLIEHLKPDCLAMCGVCAGHPSDTELGDVVLADRLFQHDEGKLRQGGFQGDFWIDALRADWLHVAQDMAGAAKGLHGYQEMDGEIWKWWLLDQVSAGRDPLKVTAFHRFIPSTLREERLRVLLDEDLITLKGEIFLLTEKGTDQLQRRRVLAGGIVSVHPTALPFHIHVAPMGSGNAVEASGEVWRRLENGGMRKALAVEMEAAALGRIAHDRGLRFAVVKGVMDHADTAKRDGYKPFAARASAEVLCRFLRNVVTRAGGTCVGKTAPRVPSPVSSPLDVEEELRAILGKDASGRALASILGRPTYLGSSPDLSVVVGVAQALVRRGSTCAGLREVFAHLELAMAQLGREHPQHSRAGLAVACEIVEHLAPSGSQDVTATPSRGDIDLEVETLYPASLDIMVAREGGHRSFLEWRDGDLVGRGRIAEPVFGPVLHREPLSIAQEFIQLVAREIGLPSDPRHYGGIEGLAAVINEQLQRFTARTPEGTPGPRFCPRYVDVVVDGESGALTEETRRLVKGFLQELQIVARQGKWSALDGALMSVRSLYEDREKR